MFENKSTGIEKHNNHKEFPKQSKEMIKDFKDLLSNLVEKYSFVKSQEDLLKINRDELRADLLEAQSEIENLRQKNNNPDFKKYFYEFSSVLSGAIHDIRNAINFLLNQLEYEENLSMFFFYRFFSYYEKFQKRETITEFVGQSIYIPFEKIRNEFLQIFKNSFADFNYKISYADDFDAQDEINYNTTALLLLFNELATNLKKYGEKEEIKLKFCLDYWQLEVQNQIKTNISDKTFSSHTGMKVLEQSVKILSGEILENGIKDNMYKFKAHLSLNDED